ncbi:MAG: PIN domain-containing protein [Caldilineaceae bacterium]|nr:PIN domain-containing protein [Caldilineaceae bacterium]
MISTTPKNEYVTDTMGLVLRLERRKMGSKAKALFQSADDGKAVIHIPGFVFAEILYLSERNRIQATLQDVSSLLAKTPTYRQVPLTFEIVQVAANLRSIPELHDRLIAATSVTLNLSLISNDPLIAQSSNVECIW